MLEVISIIAGAWAAGTLILLAIGYLESRRPLDVED